MQNTSLQGASLRVLEMKQQSIKAKLQLKELMQPLTNSELLTNNYVNIWLQRS